MRHKSQVIIFSDNQFRFGHFLDATKLIDVDEVDHIPHPIGGGIMGMIVKYKAGWLMDELMQLGLHLLMDKTGRWRRDELMRMGYLTERKRKGCE